MKLYELKQGDKFKLSNVGGMFEVIKVDGWQVSDCYKIHDDKFLRKDAQDAYEGAKWAWNHQQKKIDELQAKIDIIIALIETTNSNEYTALSDIKFLKISIRELVK